MPAAQSAIRLSLAAALGLFAACDRSAAPVPERPAVPFDHDHPQLRAFLQQHVRHGMADYAQFKEGNATLDAYLAQVAQVPHAQFEGWTVPQRLAFLLNVYNASMLRLAARHYPLDEVTDIGGFGSVFKMPVVELFARKHSLDDVEHGMIRRQFRSPQVHFALVCGARSCPPLRNEPYTAATLETQFADQARQFLADPKKNRVDVARKVVHLSPIFKWFSEDFGKSDREIIEFVAPHFSAEAAAALRAGGFSLQYTDYDWSLNDARAAPREK